MPRPGSSTGPIARSAASSGEKIELGALLHRGPDRWLFSYEVGTENDEPAFKFDRHRFLTGEYVSVTEHDGVTRTFKVVSVR